MSFIKDIDNIIACNGGLNYIAHTKYIELCKQNFSKTQKIRDFFSDYIVNYLYKEDRRAGNSLYHENGFTKISLWKSENTAQLRLHIWPNVQYSDTGIHSHRWDLSSYVISGTLHAWNYRQMSPETTMPKHNLFRIYDAVAGNQPFEDAGHAGLKVSAAYTVSDGEGHYLDFETMHKIHKSGGRKAFTLMLSGPEQSPYSFISHDETFVPSGREYLTPQMIEQILMSVELD
ncbi:hypothetical protein B7W85_02485 [Allorhizobium ampelinum]|nr:hypothetical protein [Allorhizobium ampelinum]OVE97153.1 hypothetical protein B7W85_02485 [Allorhizobium ampelinum]